jgi:hypothetical protein
VRERRGREETHGKKGRKREHWKKNLDWLVFKIHFITR